MREIEREPRQIQDKVQGVDSGAKYVGGDTGDW